MRRIVAPARAGGRLAAALLLAGALAPLGGCGADGPSGLPAPSPPTAVEPATAEHTLSGLPLPLPETWQVSERSEGQAEESWAATAQDPDAGDSPVLMVSAPMGTTDAGQAEQAGTALIAATVTDYRQSGVVSIGASATATGTPSPTAVPDGSGSSAPQLAAPSGTAAPSAGPSAVPGAVVRVTFTYSRGQEAPQGRAWIVPTSAGYVVVMLLDPSDVAAAPIERTLEEAAA